LLAATRDKFAQRLHRVARIGLIGLGGVLAGLGLILVFPVSAAASFGVLLVILSALFLFDAFWLAMGQLRELDDEEGSDADPGLWLKGARGEQQTALILEPLRHDGFVILHDRREPRSSGNIDHIVLGPSGIFIIETKSWAGVITTTEQDLYCNRTDVLEAPSALSTHAISQAQAEARAVWAVTGASHWVTAIVCIHGATMANPEAAVQKSFVVRPDHLLGFLRRDRGYTLSPEEVARLARMADLALPPNIEPGHADAHDQSGGRL
jgi:hypothetical protein